LLFRRRHQWMTSLPAARGGQTAWLLRLQSPKRAGDAQP
jgi:hypothetical protein